MDCEKGRWGDAQCSQPGTNAEHIPTVGALPRAPKLSTQDAVLPVHTTTVKPMLLMFDWKLRSGIWRRPRRLCLCRKNEDRGGLWWWMSGDGGSCLGLRPASASWAIGKPPASAQQLGMSLGTSVMGERAMSVLCGLWGADQKFNTDTSPGPASPALLPPIPHPIVLPQ